MRGLLNICLFGAIIGSLYFILEIFSVTTVLQQISARIGLAISVLIAAVSAGSLEICNILAKMLPEEPQPAEHKERDLDPFGKTAA